MPRMTRSFKKRLEDLRRIAEEDSGSDPEENFDEQQAFENESENDDNTQQSDEKSDDDICEDSESESLEFDRQDSRTTQKFICYDKHKYEDDKSVEKNLKLTATTAGYESEASEDEEMVGKSEKNLKLTTPTAGYESEDPEDEEMVGQSEKNLKLTTPTAGCESEDPEDEEMVEQSDDDDSSDATNWSSDSSDESDYELDEDWVWEVGLDGSVWKQHFAEPSTMKGKVPVENILRKKPGPTPHAYPSVSDISSAFHLFLDDDVLNYICECTVKEAKRTLQTDNWILSKTELIAFIAICYSRGALGLKNMSVTNIFFKKYGPSFIRDTMSRDRFKTIMKFLRFDDKETRKQRLETDKFALMSQVWYRFIDNCKKCYNPGVNVTVDEQLFPTKARCPFTQFMKDKMDKFGIKFFFVVDLDSKYILNGFPFTGKDMQQNDQPAGERVVLKLMEPYFNGGHTVTTDNFFTGLNLAVLLKEKNTTLIGTANKQRRWLPETAKLKNPKLPLYESNIYLGPDGTTLTLYQSKRNKSVSILSSLHKTVEITNTEKKKPETIIYYNQTKFGVDIADQMAKKYSVKSASRRWPVQVFYNVLDLAAINAWILYTETTGNKISRLNFLMDLAESLRKPYIDEKNVNTSESSNSDAIGIALRTKTRNVTPVRSAGFLRNVQKCHRNACIVKRKNATIKVPRNAVFAKKQFVENAQPTNSDGVSSAVLKFALYKNSIDKRQSLTSHCVDLVTVFIINSQN